MNISEFCDRYAGVEPRSIDSQCSKWETAELRKGIPNATSAGVVLADLLSGDGTLDQISPELLSAFSSLYGETVDTADEVRHLLLEKLADGDASVQGLVNQVKGRVGELEFQRAAETAGLQARLADSANQDAWDVAIEHSNRPTQYVQVKTHADADSVLSDVRAMGERLASGTVTDGDKIVRQVDVAVPEEIAEEVSLKIAHLEIEANVYPMQMSASEAAQVVEAGFQNVGPEVLANLFKELTGSVATAAILHSVANAFLVYKESKDLTSYFYTTTEDTILSTGTILASMSVELVLRKISLLGGLPTYALVFGTSLVTRSFLERITRRGDYAERIAAVNLHLRELTAGLAAA